MLQSLFIDKKADFFIQIKFLQFKQAVSEKYGIQSLAILRAQTKCQGQSQRKLMIKMFVVFCFDIKIL